jgi:E3 ubiquitin-protein ligase BOI-like protein
VEEQLSLRIRDRELELERVNRRNLELEQRLKQMGMETHVWQSKAKSYEAMVAMLRANLNQALINQSKEQHVRIEGYGDNEADDALSAHVDESDGAKKSRAMMLAMKETTSSAPPSADAKRYCRKCMAMEACILLLPCMHLCVCSDCQRDVEKCPICGSQRSACVEVYLS